MLIRNIFLLSVIFSFSLAKGVENLTLPQALERLKEKNLELRISRFNEQMKALEIKAAKGYHFGKLDASVTAMRSNDAGNVFGFKLQSREAAFGDFGFSEFDMSGNTNPLPVVPKSLNYPKARNHYLTKISYTLPLYTGGKILEYGRISKAMHRMSEYDTQKLLGEKIFQTKKTFYDIALVNKYIANLSKIRQNIKRLERVVDTMKKEGYAQDMDILEVQARAAEVQSMYNQAKLNRDLAYQFLSFLLDMKVSSIKKSNEMAPMPVVDKNDILENNLDIKKARLGLNVSKMALNIEKSNFYPTVGAFAEYSSADDEIWNEFRDKDAYSVGVQIKWNLFNGGIDSVNYERAKVNYMKVKDKVDLAKKGILLKVQKLKTEIFSKDADIKSLKKQLSFAKKVYKNYHARYKEGIVSISDLLVKQSKELEVLLKLLSAKNERNKKIFELNSILNKGGEA